MVVLFFDKSSFQRLMLYAVDAIEIKARFESRNVEDKSLAKADDRLFHADAPCGINDLYPSLSYDGSSQKVDVQDILGGVRIGRNVGGDVLDAPMA